MKPGPTSFFGSATLFTFSCLSRWFGVYDGLFLAMRRMREQLCQIDNPDPITRMPSIPSKIELDLTNGPLRKLLKLLDTQVISGLGVLSVGPVGDFLDL